MQHRIPMQTRRDYKILGPFTMAGLGTLGVAGVIDLGWVRVQPWPIPLRLGLGIVIALLGVGASLIRWPANDGGDLPLTWVTRIAQFYFSEGSTPRRFWTAAQPSEKPVPTAKAPVGPTSDAQAPTHPGGGPSR